MHDPQRLLLQRSLLGWIDAHRDRAYAHSPVGIGELARDAAAALDTDEPAVREALSTVITCGYVHGDVALTLSRSGRMLLGVEAPSDAPTDWRPTPSTPNGSIVSVSVTPADAREDEEGSLGVLVDDVQRTLVRRAAPIAVAVVLLGMSVVFPMLSRQTADVMAPTTQPTQLPSTDGTLVFETHFNASLPSDAWQGGAEGCMELSPQGATARPGADGCTLTRNMPDTFRDVAALVVVAPDAQAGIILQGSTASYYFLLEHDRAVMEERVDRRIRRVVEHPMALSASDRYWLHVRRDDDGAISYSVRSEGSEDVTVVDDGKPFIVPGPTDTSGIFARTSGDARAYVEEFSVWR